MKKIIGLLLIALSIFTSGCEKVIDLDLNNTKPVIVIEANLNDLTGPQIVKVSKTYDFKDPNRFNFVSGATVVLTGSDGTVSVYRESAITPGVYESSRTRGRSDVKYTMKVTVEGITYTAISIMPQKVDLNSLSFRTYTFFDKTNTYLVANFFDPPYIQNQYRYVIRVNGNFFDSFVSDDHFDNGNHVSNALFADIKDLKTGDIITVDLQSIDRNVFKYYFTIAQISGDGPPVSPANPDSNFDNGALGVFSAHAVSTRIIINP